MENVLRLSSNISPSCDVELLQLVVEGEALSSRAWKEM